jgi:hypothetical protein
MTLRTRATAVALYFYRAWRGITEPFRLDRTPAWITLAIAAVSIPLLVWRLSHGFTAGDFGTVVLTATLIALVWTAHYTFRAVRHARQVEERESIQRRLARQSMAMGVIAELEYLKPSLALMHARIAVRGVHFLERPQLRHALSRIDLFSSAAAHDLSQFDSILRQIESHAILYGADYAAAKEQAEKSWVGGSGGALLNYNSKWVGEIRTMIESAQTLIPHVGRRLLEEA